jgi:hypothetical protein
MANRVVCAELRHPRSRRCDPDHLVKLGILRDLSGKTRYRVLFYARYMEVLNEDEE